MEESEKENLYFTFKAVIDSIIEDKKRNPKNIKKLNSLEIAVNLGLQIDKDYIYWMNLRAKNGIYKLEKGKLEEYDLVLISAPEDLMFFSNGENSTLHMITKKNRFGNKKLQIKRGTTGRNIKKLLKLSSILVLDKVKSSN
ncbi:MAG: hypothetical protein ACTSQJ_03965 [Promethearchaeota archaeon]